jgi:protein-disulfide isomerase
MSGRHCVRLGVSLKIVPCLTHGCVLLSVGMLSTLVSVDARADSTVAKVAGQTVLAAEVDEEARGELTGLRFQEYEIRQRALDRLISKSLLSREATARKLTVDDLVKLEVTEKTKPVTAEEARAVYESAKQRYQALPENIALDAISRQMFQGRVNDRRAAYIADLRSKAAVEVMLAPPRVVVAARDGAVKGRPDARVQLVAFSDFQCPACSRLLPVLDKLQKKYGQEIAIGFRHFPLTSHPDAPAAAAAAECAREKGKFWEMHDVLFSNQRALKTPSLKAYATQIGLDETEFADCLTSARPAVQVKEDREKGETFGVRATPTVYVNGRMVSEYSEERLSRVIDEELAQPRRGAARTARDRAK